MILLIFLIVFAYGAVIGSFLNVVILRLHEGKSIGGRSECPNCHHQLSTLDLVPVVSFLVLAGKCRYCKHGLSIQYPMVELLSALALTLAFIVLYQDPRLLNQGYLFLILNSFFIILFILVLVVVSVYDLRWGIIPDKIILPSSILVLIGNFSLFLLNSRYELLNISLKNYFFDLLTAIGIGLFFLVLIVVTRGKGMGGGDLKLAIFIALFLGFPLGILGVLLGFLTGAIGSVMLLLLGKKRFKETVPFGPFLALGAYISLLFGNYIWTTYLKALGF